MSSLTAIVLSKDPRPGQVKTRLVDAPGMDRDAAAEIAAAMLRCVLDRLRRRWEVVLAAAPDGCGPRVLGRLGIAGIETADQGPGDLGDRLARLWGEFGAAGPVAFFGVDSPDVPERALDAIEPALRAAEVAVGPTEDGGYWTLAAAAPRPELLACIDWGTDRVYDQTIERAAEHGVSLRTLPRWHDVDLPADLTALRTRLAARQPMPGDDPLQRLARRLDALCGAAPRR